jgi:hypothetical protein
MKRLFVFLFVVAAVSACGNNAGNEKSVGDSLVVDPTTAQPITTEPDTIGPDSNDTTQHHQNH